VISFLVSHWNELIALPPWQPADGEHEINTCGAMLISGHAALRAILMRSEKVEVAAWAQQEPQY
jgi:hypothetical protein